MSQFFSSCCTQPSTQSQFPSKPLTSNPLSTTKSTHRLPIFSPRTNSSKNPFTFTPKQRQLKQLISYQNQLRQRIRQVDRLYEKEIRPLEEDCERFRELNGEKRQRIENVNTRLRAVENGYVRYN